MAKAYTGAGDKGDTGLIGGKRVPKSSQRVEAYGAIDEVNSFIGFAAAHLKEKKAISALKTVQHQLFILGAETAGSTDKRVTMQMVREMEKEIDSFNDELPPLTKFILPGGSHSAALLHVARAGCRRAERELVALSQTESVSPDSIAYLNRLSSLLFVLARYANKEEGVKDEEWRQE